jgi:hypothetical protein
MGNAGNGKGGWTQSNPVEQRDSSGMMEGTMSLEHGTKHFFVLQTCVYLEKP